MAPAKSKEALSAAPIDESPAKNSRTENGAEAAAENKKKNTVYNFCLRFNFSAVDLLQPGGEELMLRTASSKFKALEIQPTPLRQNRFYYKIYCIGLNTIFGSVAPLLSLIYLNICTVIGELVLIKKKMLPLL